jgi:hypothetical protein
MSFNRLDPQDFLISAESITSALWTGYDPTLSSFYTSSTQVNSTSGDYYISVYQTASSNIDAELQFDLTYGDKLGSGSVAYDSAVPGVTPTRTIFGQYRTLILGDENSDFVFGNYTSPNFFVISVNRNRYKESLFPGSLSLQISSSGGVISLTDDSRITTTNVFKDAGRVYNLVSGSAGVVNTSLNSSGWSGGATGASGSYGWFLPDIATILINPAALGATPANGGISYVTSRTNNTDGDNISKIYSAISGGGLFTLNSQETITSDYIFVRARNSEFNYSENPSFISGSSGVVVFNSFINNPQSFVTTIGLYNDNNELLATAKLSKPLKKDFTKEMLVRVKLDF